MNKDLEKDLLRTHAILNYLNAGYQSKFSYLNILSQLGANLSQDEIARNRSTLDRVSTWLKALWEEEPLFAATWEKPETFDAQKALDFLEQLLPDLDQLSGKLVALLSAESAVMNPDDLRLLIASLGRHAYSRDNYMRGYVDFGKRFKKTDLVTEYSNLLPAIADEVSLAHSLLNTFKQMAKPDAGFCNRVRYEAMKLPGSFRMQIHDIRQLTFPLRGTPLSYERFMIPDERADAWKRLGASPQLAGYWEAHYIAPEEAAGWTQIGVSDFNLAGIWKFHGFSPAKAKEWLDAKIGPFDAMIWSAEGFNAKDAKANIEAGAADPSQVISKK